MFTDIEGSTRLRGASARTVRRLLGAPPRAPAPTPGSRPGGHVVDTDADSFLAAFGHAAAAVRGVRGRRSGLVGASRGRSRRRCGCAWGCTAGSGLAAPWRYVSLAVHRAARVMAAAHGGQVLLTEDAVIAATVEPEDALVPDRAVSASRLRRAGAAARLLGAGLDAEFPAVRAVPATATTSSAAVDVSSAGTARSLTSYPARRAGSSRSSARRRWQDPAGNRGRPSMAPSWVDGVWLVDLRRWKALR